MSKPNLCVKAGATEEMFHVGVACIQHETGRGSTVEVECMTDHMSLAFALTRKPPPIVVLFDDDGSVMFRGKPVRCRTSVWGCSGKFGKLTGLFEGRMAMESGNG